MQSIRLKVMKDVVRDLHEAEIAFDDAISAVATLSAALPQARIRAKVAATVGQGVIDSVLQACSLIGQARAKLVDTHNQLSDVKDQLKIVAAGGGYEKPLESTFLTAVRTEDIAA
ncbi:hypothetical protein [Sphingomonas trueperi]|uniref:hypothetical protein n=1 Tax=Sphingomonas trueperi TaxID=53317 RepID=UPI000F2AE75E